MRVLIAGGGTGGHLLPGVAAGKALRALGHQVHFVVRTDATSQAFLAREGFASSAFAFAGFPRAFSRKVFSYPFLAGAAFLSARRILRRERPDAVLGMGGYVSVPAGLAAAAAGVPLLLHEQNSRAGLANRLLARWARGVAVSFEKTEGLPPAARTEWTGLPLRPDLAPTDPAAARKSLGLSEDALTVLVFGGSQGARALNRLLIRSLPALSAFKERWQFIHLTGESEFAAVQAAYNTMGWRAFVRAYHHEMGVLYSAADVAVCRSGANTVMELARMGRRALLIPYPHAADNHQEFNARYLEAQGLARVELEEGLTEERFGAFLRSLPEPRALREEARIRVESLPQSWLDAPARLAAWVVKEASR